MRFLKTWQKKGVFFSTHLSAPVYKWYDDIVVELSSNHRPSVWLSSDCGARSCVDHVLDDFKKNEEKKKKTLSSLSLILTVFNNNFLNILTSCSQFTSIKQWGQETRKCISSSSIIAIVIWEWRTEHLHVFMYEGRGKKSSRASKINEEEEGQQRNRRKTGREG